MGFFFAAAISHTQAQMAAQANVREVYGSQDAQQTVKIANGGAGPTGIIRAFADAFLAERDDAKNFNIGKDVSFIQLERALKHTRAQTHAHAHKQHRNLLAW